MRNIENNKKKTRVLKRVIREVSLLKKELMFEKQRNIELLKMALKPKLGNDLLKISDIEKEYKISRKTVDRMRARGLKTSQHSPKSFVWVVRQDFEDFLKKDRYGR